MKRSFWDKDPKRWLKIFDQKKEEASRSYIVGLLKEERHGNILEIGIGGADFLRMSKAAGLTVAYTGFDCTQGFIDNAKKHYPEASFIKGDMQDMSKVADDSFDIVYTRHTLEHVEYYEKATQEMARIAKKKVVIVLCHELRDKDETNVKDWEHRVYNNYYAKKKFMQFMRTTFSHVEVVPVPKRSDCGQAETILECTV